MTIEELIDCDAAKLEKMTDAELLEHFNKYFDITRPERQSLPSNRKQEQQLMMTNPKLAQGLAIAKSLGINVGNISFIKKKS
jgi:hypothetical protein